MSRFFPRSTVVTTLATVALSLSAIAADAGAWAARHGMSPAQYQNTFNDYTSKGYRLTDISAYTVAGKQRYAAIWEKRAGSPWVARHGMSANGYQSTFDQYTSQGFAPFMVDGMGSGKGKFAALWAKTPRPWVARHGLSSSAYQAEFNKWVGQGYRLIDVSGYAVGGKARYAAIWMKGGGQWKARHGMTSAKYQAAVDQYKAQGYRPAQVDGYTVNGRPYFAAIWTKGGKSAWVARHGLTGAAYQAEFNKWTAQGYKLTDVSGYSQGGQARYIAIWEK